MAGYQRGVAEVGEWQSDAQRMVGYRGPIGSTKNQLAG